MRFEKSRTLYTFMRQGFKERWMDASMDEKQKMLLWYKPEGADEWNMLPTDEREESHPYDALIELLDDKPFQALFGTDVEEVYALAAPFGQRFRALELDDPWALDWKYDFTLEEV